MNMPPHLFVPLIPPLAVMGFAAFWCLVCWVVARIGGWHTLATRFPAGPGKPVGVRMFYMESLELGASRYKGSACVGVAPEGLYLSVIALFRVGHKPILVPWSAIKQIKAEKQWWLTYYELSVPLQKFDTATITLFNGTLIANTAPHLPHLSIPAAPQR